MLKPALVNEQLITPARPLTPRTTPVGPEFIPLAPRVTIIYHNISYAPLRIMMLVC